MIICKLCYREFEKDKMAMSAGGDILDYCRTCTGILGHDFGRHSRFSDEEANEWFEGINERKAKLNIK